MENESTSTGPAASTPPVGKRGITRAGWVGIGVAVALVVAAAVTVPVVQAAELSSSQAAFDSAVADLEVARADYENVTEDRDQILPSTAALYNTLTPLFGSMTADLFDPGSAWEMFVSARDELTRLPGFTLRADGVLVPPTVETLPIMEVPAAAGSKDEIDEQTRQVREETERTIAATTAVLDAAEAVQDVSAELNTAVSTMVTAAAKRAGGLSYPKASAEAQAALAAAVNGLTPAVAVDYNAAVTALTKFASSNAAAAKSQADTVAKENQKRDAAKRNGGSKPKSDGSSKSDSGKKSNGGKKSGGGAKEGSKGGSGGGGSSTPPRGKILKTGAACKGSGGGASGNWISNLVAPADSVNVRVTQSVKGKSWAIAWDCDLGW